MEAKINISIKDGEIEITGSEEFVNKQIENFRDLIINIVENANNQIRTKNPEPQSQPSVSQAVSGTNSQEDSENPIEQYPYVYVEDEDELKLVCDLPGNSTAKKNFNAALLYTYGKKLMGEDEVGYECVMQICRNHGCVDSNFSANIKSGDPKFYLDKGDGKERTIKLNRPGIKEAKKLINKIMENEEQ